MRWLLLINLLAVVLLSGAVAIVIEGTPIGSGPLDTEVAISMANDARAGEQLSTDQQADDEDLTGLVDLADLEDLQMSDQGTQGVDVPEIQKPVDEQPTVPEQEESLAAAPGTPVPLPAPRELAPGEPALGEITPAELVVPVQQAVEPTIVVKEAEPPTRELAPMRVATEGAFAPFNFIGAEGEASGFDVDIAREVCRRLQRECVFEVRAWADLLPALKRGDVDLIAASMRIPSNLPDGVVFSDPYYGSRAQFVISRGAGITGPGMLRAPGSQIAVQGGSIHEAYLKARYSDIDLVLAKSLEAALLLVAEGKVEAAFGDNVAILQWLKDERCCMALGNAISDDGFFGQGIGLAMRTEDQTVREEVNKQLQVIATDGTSERISERYFGGSIY